MAIDVKEVEQEGYGKCLALNNGVVEILVTIDIGPRIIYFGLIGGNNIFYQDREHPETVHTPEFEELYAGLENRQYRLYGGHRLWLSPQNRAATYYPDNQPVVYGITPDGVSFTPPIQQHNKMQVSLTVMMPEGASDIMLIHSAKNMGKENRSFSICSITALKGGGLEIIPKNPSINNFAPNQEYVMWPYSQMTDPRVHWGKKYVTIHHNPGYEPEFKMGTNNALNWAAYVHQDVVLVKRYVHELKAIYPDGGASFETYCNSRYLEMETLSPVYRIEPGETIKHVENLTLYPVNTTVHPTDQNLLDQFISTLL